MADRRAKATPDVTKPQALVGSAQILKASRVNAPRNAPWAAEAWGFWRTTPEPSFAANWLGHGFSLCRLYAAKRPPSPGDEPEPITTGAAVDLVAQLGGGIVGQQQLLHSFGVHLTVPGVGYLTGQQGASAFDSWQVLSADELRVQGRGYEVLVGEQEWAKAPPETLVVKCWRPDEQFHWRPWSPMQPVLPVLRELDGLSKKIDADIVSRLASAGIILIPSEVEFPVRPEFADADDPLMAEIIEVVSTAIRDRASAAANVPVFIRVPGEYVDKIKHLTWTTALDEMSIKLREEARGRFAVGMDMPAEVLTGLGCLDDQAEILTSDGWKGIDALQTGDEVLSLDHDAGCSTWAPVTDVHRYDFDGDLYEISGPLHHSLTTAEHRWPVERYLCGESGCDRAAHSAGRCPRCYKRARKRQGGGSVPPIAVRVERHWVTSETLTDGDRLILGAPCMTLPVVAKWNDAFVEVAAWAATDADISHDRIRIRQSPTANQAKCERIEAALAVAFPDDHRSTFDTAVGCWSYYLSGAGTAALLAVGSRSGTRLVLSTDFVRSLTAAQLELLLSVGVLANGHGSSMFAVDGARLDAFELAAVLRGYRVSRTIQPPGRTSFSDNDICRLNWGPHSRFRPSTTLTPYRGRVWCPTVLGTSSYLARSRGRAFFTGNSIQHWGQWFLDEQGIKYHIRPGLAAVCQGITLGYLAPGLVALGQSDPEAMIWYDASELTTRPDLSANMQALYDRLEVNGKSLRRETGADESDKPDKTELAEMAFKAMLKDPALVAVGLAGLGLPVPDIALANVTPIDASAPDVVPVEPVGESPPATPEDMNPPPPGVAAVAASANGNNAALVAAADGLVCRALEKAGNRVRQKLRPKQGAKDDCPPLTTHECLGGVGACGVPVAALLAGAWERVPDIAFRLHVDPIWLTQSLELYAAGLLDSGRAHTWENLESFLVAEMP